MGQSSPLRDIFAAALEIDSDQERQAYLDQACGDDAALRAEVEALLRADADAGSFMREDDLDRTAPLSGITAGIGQQIGPFTLIEQIGEGGFGIVYRAEQKQPVRREVALKLIKPGMDTREVIARFEAERQALAVLNHPHIAKVLDAGTTDEGRPYFVMELVRGRPITTFCDDQKLDLSQRLDLFRDVCEAVQHAHQKGIIHRDIKPSNVMVSVVDGKPVVKVIDFGVAKALHQKLTDRTLWTSLHQVIGTPLYMSPEQADQAGAGYDIDTRTDVYSLGVLLYELLTGTTPFSREQMQKAGLDEVRRMIREDEPAKPSLRLSSLGDTLPSVAAVRKLEPKRLSAFIRGDLDWIVMKALEKDRDRRYATASAFADDLQRYQDHEPVEASPPSRVYRFRKFARRNKGTLATGLLVSLSLVAGIIGTTWQAIRATDAEQLAEDRLVEVQDEQTKTEQALVDAEQAADREQKARVHAESSEQAARQSEREAKWNLYVARLFPMRQAWEERNFGRLEQLLEESTPTENEPDFRGWEWYYFQDQVHSASTKLVSSDPVRGPVAWNPVADEFATRSGKFIDIWKANTLTRRDRFLLDKPYKHIDWSPRGRFIALCDATGTILGIDSNSGQQVLASKPLPDRQTGNEIWDIKWSPDEQYVAVANFFGDISIVDIESRAVRSIHTPTRQDNCGCLAWHPSGTKLAAGLRYGKRALFDLESGEETLASDIGNQTARAMAWNPRGTWLACSEDHEIRILDESMNDLLTITGHVSNITELKWLDDARLVSAGEDLSIRLWNAATGEVQAVSRVHTEPLRSLDLSPTGQVVSATERSVRLSAFQHNPRARKLRVAKAGLHRVGTISVDELIKEDRLIGMELGDLYWARDGLHVAAPARFSYSDRAGTFTGYGHLRAVWNMVSQKQLSVDPRPLPSGTGMRWQYGHQTIELLTASREHHEADLLLGKSRLCGTTPPKTYDAATRDRNFEYWQNVDWHPTEPLVAVTDNYNWWFDVVDLRSNTRAAHVETPHYVTYLKWDGLGKRIAVCGGKCVVYESGGDVIATSRRIIRGTHLDWDPLDHMIALATENNEVIIFAARDLSEVIRLAGHHGHVTGVDWSPDGRRLASSGQGGTIRIWDCASGVELLQLTADEMTQFTSVEWSPDGVQLGATTAGGGVYIWGSDAMQPTPTTATILETGVVATALRELNGGKFPPVPNVPRLGWKTYAVPLRPILRRIERGETPKTVSKSWQELSDSIADEDDPLQARRDFVTAMIHLVEAGVSPEGTRWLADRLIENLNQEVVNRPQFVEVWRDLAEAHLVIARNERIADDSERHWRSAASALSEVIKLDADDETALQRRAYVRTEHLGDPQGAAADRIAALKIRFTRAGATPLESQSVFWQRSAEVRLAAGDLEGALADCDQLLSSAGASATAGQHQLRADVLAKLNRQRDSLADWQRALQLNPDAGVDQWREYGARAFEVGEFAESIDALRHAVDRSPEDCLNLFRIDLHKLASCPDEEFRQQYAELADVVVETSPYKPAAHGVRGLVATALGNDALADEDLQQAFDAAMMLSHDPEVVTDAETRKANRYQFHELAYMLGYAASLLQNRGDIEGAILRRRQAIAIGTPLYEAYPEYPSHFSRLIVHLTNLAALERQTGESTAATSTMKQLVALEQQRLQSAAGDMNENDLVRSLQELLSLALEVHDEAVVAETIAQLSELVARNVTYANDAAWFAIRYPVDDPEVAEQALAWARAAVESDPKHSSYHNTLGVACYRAGRFEDAIAALSQSEELSSGESLGYNAFFLAMACQQTGQPDEARQWFDKAVAWTRAYASEHAELRRFQEEAAELLGVTAGEPETEPLSPGRPPAPALPMPAGEKVSVSFFAESVRPDPRPRCWLVEGADSRSRQTAKRPMDDWQLGLCQLISRNARASGSTNRGLASGG